LSKTLEVLQLEHAHWVIIVVVTDLALVTERAIEGPPVIVVEVLAPSSIAYDRLTKSRRYAALGVPHFWIVDIAKPCLRVLSQPGRRVPAHCPYR
jgi:Uma2 family endonuclease